MAAIRVGVGGWTFGPWRGTFYPPKLPQKRELEHASRQLTSIEVNGTYYGSQKPASFIKWREETPDGFVFSLKGPRFTTNRRVLAEAGSSIERFLTGGVLELKEKLGPINWQMPSTKQYDPDDFEAFLKLLPAQVDGSAASPRRRGAPQKLCLPGLHRAAADLRGGRGDGRSVTPIRGCTTQLHRSSTHVCKMRRSRRMQAMRPTRWAHGRSARSSGPPGRSRRTCLCSRTPESKPPKSRDVFIYMINGFKPKAPAAAMALIERLSA